MMRRDVERIEIQGKKVLLYRDGTPHTPNREVPLEDFLREVTASVRRPGRGHHLLLPPGARIVKLEGVVNLLCTETPPQAWEAASEAAPLFPLQVPWERLDLTIGEVIDHLVESGPQPRQAIADASDLANLMYRIAESK